MSKTIFLLDAMALIYRAHFAFSKAPRINGKGENVSAAFGFTNALLEIINKKQPTHIAVGFDLPGPTFRHKQFPEYKAHREEQPEDITSNIPLVRQIVEAFDIPILEKETYEADDVIGTIAKKAEKEDFLVYMMTPDKDYAQLVSDKIFLYKPAYMGNAVDILGIQEVLDKFDIKRVDQVRDILGLEGDKADNIPGIPGVGKKTAIKYLKTYGTVENLVAHVEDLKGKAKENVLNYGAMGILSKDLATIKTDVPIDFDANAAVLTPLNESKIMPIFEKLEFRTMAKRIFGNVTFQTPPPKKKKQTANQPSLFDQAPSNDRSKATASTKEKALIVGLKTIENTPHQYQLIDTEDKRIYFLAQLLKQQAVCFDTETDSLNANEAQLVGIAFAYKSAEAYYVPIPEDFEEASSIVSYFKPFFEDDKITKIGQNLKYDILVLKKYDVEIAGPIFDTMLAHYLIEPDNKHNMDFLAEKYLQYQPVSIRTLIGKKGSKQLSMREVPLEEVKEYAAEDADITFQLKGRLEELLDEQTKALHDNLEAPLIHVLANMEFEGITLDASTLEKLSEELRKNAITLQEKIYELAETDFNISSPKQLGEILFDKMKLVEKPKKTKTGQYATGEEILSKLANDHEIASKILEFRQCIKLKNTYVDALPALISPHDGRIHTTYAQAVAATGRLSSNNPNLQNIPVRTERGRAIRAAFVPRGKDFILMAADYSQIELRIMAAFSGDEHMIDAFKNGRDIHATTAAKIFKIPLKEVSREQRSTAKSANFGIIYGISAFGLAQNLNISRTEAKEIIDTYFEEFPKVKEYMDRVINEARELGYVETYKKRRRYLRDINSANQTQRGFAERNAINAPIQGSAADMIKIAMISINEWMIKEKLKSKMILQVHDELVFDVHLNEKELMAAKIPEMMQGASDLVVPMEVEVGFGKDWLEAH